jgi:hypothetical protein
MEIATSLSLAALFFGSAAAQDTSARTTNPGQSLGDRKLAMAPTMACVART